MHFDQRDSVSGLCTVYQRSSTPPPLGDDQEIFQSVSADLTVVHWSVQLGLTILTTKRYSLGTPPLTDRQTASRCMYAFENKQWLTLPQEAPEMSVWGNLKRRVRVLDSSVSQVLIALLQSNMFVCTYSEPSASDRFNTSMNQLSA